MSMPNYIVMILLTNLKKKFVLFAKKSYTLSGYFLLSNNYLKSYNILAFVFCKKILQKAKEKGDRLLFWNGRPIGQKTSGLFFY